MNNLVSGNCYNLTSGIQNGGDGLFSSFLSALPMAVAKPVLEYRRLNAQTDIIIKAIESNEKTKEDIMKTIRELGESGNLTPELVQYLFAAYNQALIQMPF